MIQDFCSPYRGRLPFRKRGKTFLAWWRYKFPPKCNKSGHKIMSEWRSKLRISALTCESIQAKFCGQSD